MFDAQTALYVLGVLAVVVLLRESRQKSKARRQLEEVRADYVENVKNLNLALAEKNKTLTAEYLNKKKVTDLVDALRVECEGAKARMLQLNDALNVSRELHENSKKENGVLVEEVVSLNGLIDSQGERLEMLRAQCDEAEGRLAAMAKINIKNVKKVAAKSVKKKRA